jgi:hypothetical protein
MQTLNLSGTQLPASRFPEPADVYLCDDCGRDLTEHLHPGRAHIWRSLGPARYTCFCGQKYLSGASEWDLLGVWERRQRVLQIIIIAVLTCLPLIAFGMLIHFVLERSSPALLLICYFAILPAAVLFVLFIVGVLLPLLEIGASIVRTRIR